MHLRNEQHQIKIVDNGKEAVDVCKKNTYDGYGDEWNEWVASNRINVVDE